MALTSPSSCAVALATCLLISACSSPTPAPQPDPYARAVYIAALDAAALRLTGAPPTEASMARIEAGGRAAYDAQIDAYTDLGQNPALRARMWSWFKDLFGADDVVAEVLHPLTGEVTTIRHNASANLAAWLFEGDRPWTEIVTSEVCVRESVDEGGVLTGLDEEACVSQGGPVAGVLTQPGFLRRHGQVTSFERVSAIHLLFSCKDYPDLDDPGFIRCNNCGDGQPELVPAAEDPAGPSMRMLARYKEQACYDCHTTLSPRRLALVKFDRDGLYNPRRTIYDVETPTNTHGHCVVVPRGYDAEALTPCCDVEGTCLEVGEALDQPGGCCFDPMITDTNAAETSFEVGLGCLVPGSPWCRGFYYGRQMSHPEDWARLMLDPEVNDNAFYDCAATWFTRFAQGDTQGMIGLRQDNMEFPVRLDEATGLRLGARFEEEGWNARLFLRAVFKDRVFLDRFDP